MTMRPPSIKVEWPSRAGGLFPFKKHFARGLVAKRPPVLLETLSVVQLILLRSPPPVNVYARV
jgi:hypothetical protein